MSVWNQLSYYIPKISSAVHINIILNVDENLLANFLNLQYKTKFPKKIVPTLYYKHLADIIVNSWTTLYNALRNNLI